MRRLGRSGRGEVVAGGERGRQLTQGVEVADDTGRFGCGSAGGGTPGLALLALLLLRRR